jgi:hypothetical protein
VLLAIAVGSVISMPLSGLVVARLGHGAHVAVMALVAAAGLAAAGLGYRVGVVPVVVGLFRAGRGQRHLGRGHERRGLGGRAGAGAGDHARFHAGFSIGTVAGALVGAAMVALGVSATVHLVAVALFVAVAGPLAVRDFVPEGHARAEHGERRNPLKAWTEPRTVLIGVFVFAAAFTEGTGNDWLGVAMIDGLRRGRRARRPDVRHLPGGDDARPLVRPGLIDRHGRVRPCGSSPRWRWPGSRWSSGARPARGHGRRGAVGARHGARLPGGDERGGRRPAHAAAG